MQTGELLSLVAVASNTHQAEQLARLHAAGFDARGRAGVAQFPILYQGKMAAPLRQICRVAA